MTDVELPNFCGIFQFVIVYCLILLMVRPQFALFEIQTFSILTFLIHNIFHFPLLPINLFSHNIPFSKRLIVGIQYYLNQVNYIFVSTRSVFSCGPLI